MKYESGKLLILRLKQMEGFCGCGESFKSEGNTCLEIKVSKVLGAGGVSMDQTSLWEGPSNVMEWRQNCSLACDTRPASFKDGAAPSPDCSEPGRRPLALISLVRTRRQELRCDLLPQKLM